MKKKTEAGDILNFLHFFFLENVTWHFMQIIC